MEVIIVGGRYPAGTGVPPILKSENIDITVQDVEEGSTEKEIRITDKRYPDFWMHIRIKP